jgi:antitoxin (DNA-binding transcriptional repressor) of toxin-antitoxin stability system
MSCKLFYMKKVTSREFQQRFGRLQSRLGRGETVQVTHRGKVSGQFTKISQPAVKKPDFLANVRAEGYSRELGNEILREFHAGLS